MKALSRALVTCACLIALTLSTSASAEDGGSVADARRGSADATAADAVVEDPAEAAYANEMREVRDLMAGRLAPAVDPATLFEVSLHDDDAVRVDAERLRRLLAQVEVDAGARHVKKGAASVGPSRAPRGADAGSRDAAPLDAELWGARLGLDRARLAFYELPSARRRALLATHEKARPDAGAPPSEAELRARAAEQERQAALRSAQSARTEAARLVSTELARLLKVERAQAEFSADLAKRRKDVTALGDATLSWEQRGLEAREHPGSTADETYDDLRRALRAARDSLSGALTELAAASSGVPVAGPNPLADLGVAVDTGAATAERGRVDAEASRLAGAEDGVRWERAEALFDQIDSLNHERLALLSDLTPAKRDAVTGFTSAGWDQAASEVRQLSLVLRYHRHIVGRWLLALRHPGRALEPVLAGGVFHAFEWMLAIAAFAWWRRRAKPLLAAIRQRAREEDRLARLASPSPATRALDFVVQVHRPIEWLVLLLALQWLLPAATQQLLEVRVFTVLMTWIFGASLVVDAINAVAGAERGGSALRPGEINTAALRLRSLRLVGRVVVVFGLILGISAMLVGRGTVYSWVFSTCWLAAAPLLLVLVRWWRDVVFNRTERVRKPSRVQRWVLGHRVGWASFVAATAGGAYLFGSGAARAARNWVGRFVITRRALAYLFRRQLGKRENTQAVGQIAAAAFDSLGPEMPPAHWVENDSDAAIDRLALRIRERRGGVVALVGERGMGKTSTLGRLRRDEAGDMLLLGSPRGDLGALRAGLADGLGPPLSPTATFGEVVAALAASPTKGAVLVDDAHRFVKPVVGGLADFDAILEAANRHAGNLTWVFAFDDVVWPFLARARDSRPLFDDVIPLERWSEAHIVSLLRSRTEQSGLAPSFEQLLEPLPATADEVDRQEALAQCEADYYRLLWDSARGNPGVALHMWRCSLGTDAAGRAAVRAVTALDARELERLPDPAVFTLRAVLQLEPASAERIATGTMIHLADVTDALRYATSRGYVEERDGGYRVTWTWFRTITLFLQRRHLLVTR
jgi:hypothetical protein